MPHKKARTQKEAGVDKRVSEPVYPSDILSDSALLMCSLETFGAWMKCLLSMWRDKQSYISATLVRFSRLWGVDNLKVEEIIYELETCKVCDVRKCNDNVTLICRRLKRREKTREQTRIRVNNYRRNAKVTAEKGCPSISSSISTSVSTPLPPEFVERNPAFKKLVESEHFKAVTPEQYKKLCQLYPKADPMKAVERALLDAEMSLEDIKSPAGFLKFRFDMLDNQEGRASKNQKEEKELSIWELKEIIQVKEDEKARYPYDTPEHKAKRKEIAMEIKRLKGIISSKADSTR